MEKKFNILIADHNDLRREKIAGLFSRRGAVRMVTQVSSAAAAEDAARETMPDLVLVEMRLAHHHDGMLARVRGACPSARIHVLSDDDGAVYHKAAAGLGADGLIFIPRIEEDMECIIGVALKPRKSLTAGNIG